MQIIARTKPTNCAGQKQYSMASDMLVVVLAISAVAFFSLSDPSLRPDAGLGSGNIDHFFAYLALGALTAGLRCEDWQIRWFLPLFVLLAGLLEIGQLLVPGRYASIENFLASAIGAWIGLVISNIARNLASAIASCLGLVIENIARKYANQA